MHELDECRLVGASLGGGFENTSELKPMKLCEALAGPDRAKWLDSVNEEHERFLKHKVHEPVPHSQVPKHCKIIDSTWACKKKCNGMFRA